MMKLKRWACMSALIAVNQFADAHAAAVGEVEPNNSCAAAQVVAPLVLNVTTTLAGALTTPPTVPDVDFYKFTSAPGRLARVKLSGALDGTHTLMRPIVAVLDSACNFIMNQGVGDPDVFTVAIPPDGVIIFAVSSEFDFGFTGAGFFAGTYTLGLTAVDSVKSIAGRVVVAGSQTGVDSVFVALNLCNDTTCQSSQFISEIATDSLGQFAFESNAFGFLIAPGNYRVGVRDFSGRYQATESPIFAAQSGQQKIVPDIPLTPTPVIGSVSGRIIDSVTRAPLSGSSAPHAHIAFSGCLQFACTFVDGFVDNLGKFRFDHDAFGRGLVAGIQYQVTVTAEQYQEVFQFTAPIDAGANLDMGDIKLISNPVRFNVVRGCANIPVTGGHCKFEVEITNGVANAVKGEAWATIDASGLGSFVSRSLFQTGDPQDMKLAPATKTKRSTRRAFFEFAIPGSVPSFAFICPTFWFGTDPVNPQLFVQGVMADFGQCVQRTLTGYQPATREQAHELRKEARHHQAKRRAMSLPK